MIAAANFPQILDDAELTWIIETDDLGELRELHDRLTGQLARVDWRVRELEGSEASAAERELLRDYQASVL